MKNVKVPRRRVRQLLQEVERARILVVGDVMLDHYLWGSVGRISPEAPVPVLEFQSESFMPGGAGNVARNVRSLRAEAELFGVVGNDAEAGHLGRLFTEQAIGCAGLVAAASRPTSIKTRIIAHSQQVVRIDREARDGLDGRCRRALTERLAAEIPAAAAVVVCDYGKGVVSQTLLDFLKQACHDHGVWLSFDPKPVHRLNLSGLSLITPNRKEAFELAAIADETRNIDPLKDTKLASGSRKTAARTAAGGSVNYPW